MTYRDEDGFQVVLNDTAGRYYDKMGDRYEVDRDTGVCKRVA